MSHEPVEIWTEQGRVGWLQNNTAVEPGLHMAIWENLADLHNVWRTLDRDNFPFHWWSGCEEERASVGTSHAFVACRVYSALSNRWFGGKYCPLCMNYYGPCGEPDYSDEDVLQGEGYPYPELMKRESHDNEV